MLDRLYTWEAPVVVATGKALPYPVALTEFIGVSPVVIAENGGILVVDDELSVIGDRGAAEAVAEEYRQRGYLLGWGQVDLANRWRETEIVVHHDQPVRPLRECARAEGLEVVDSGYAYHVKSPAVSKGAALAIVAEQLGLELSSFVAVGDSVNDVTLFKRVGSGVAVGNASEEAKAAADWVTVGRYAEGFLEALDGVEPG